MTAEQIHAPGLLKDDKLSVGVSVHGRQAVWHFSEPREFVALQANEALALGTKTMLAAVEADNSVAQQTIEMAMHLIDLVYEVQGAIKPAGGAVKHELIERHRRTLTRRLEIVMNSEREKKTTSNAALAKKVVEVLLKEVFS